MDVVTIVLATTGLIGGGLVLLAPVLVLIAVKDGRDHRWVRRHPVTPCATLASGGALPGRFAVYGRTVPGRAGLVVAPLSGAEAVWFRLMVCSFHGEDELTRVRVLFEESGGDPFGVADETGVVAVSARILQRSTFARHLSMRARTRDPVASSGPAPTRRVVDETSEDWREPGPRLRQLIERGLVREDAVRRADGVTVVEEIVPSGIPLHAIGGPAVLDGGVVGLTLPKAGRYLVLSRPPAETEKVLAGDSSFGMGCAVWVVLVGAACLAVFAAVAISATG